MRSRFASWFGVLPLLLLLLAVSASPEKLDSEEAADLNETFFISEIFDKYGNNNVMTYEGFEHLLENLGLGRLKFDTKHDVSIHKVNGTFREFHDELSLHRHEHEDRSTRRKRNLMKEDKGLMRKCLTAQDILATYGLEPYHEVVISPSKYLQMCPAIVYELDQKLCLEVEDEEADGGRTGRVQEERHHLVWVYASVSILVMGAAGMVCVLAVPLVRGHYSSLLQFLVALAVGTLCGDALIHLIPQIFTTDGKAGSEVIMVLRGTVALTAIYVFFVVEHVLKGMQEERKKRAGDGRELGSMLQPLDGHGHCHGPGSEGIKTVAWIAIMGDVLHNVTDGLSIGAAFRTSLSSGFSSSIAIFCHELPHELGDYAILLASGMSVRKSLFYNALSSVFSYVGMVAGVLLGEIEDASLWINSFTAGSFLYIALSDLVPEMKMPQNGSTYRSFLVQTMGLMCGGILMFAVALYEDQIENLLC